MFYIKIYCCRFHRKNVDNYIFFPLNLILIVEDICKFNQPESFFLINASSINEMPIIDSIRFQPKLMKKI